MPVCIRAELSNRDGFLAQLAGVADIPALETDGGDLGVKLEGEAVVLKCECLVWVKRSAGKKPRAGRQVEGVAVPVEDR